MFTKFPDQLWPYLTSPSEIAVMLRILKLVGFDGKGECFEEARTFANGCGISPRTLTDVLRSLEAKNLIVVSRSKKKLNRIVLGEITKKIVFSSKICRHKEIYNNIFIAAEFAAKKTEAEVIHEKWLKKKAKGELPK